MTRVEKPILFLDVDGVLNCISRHEDYEHHITDGIPVWVPTGTKERVAKLLDHFDPIWATAWQGTAHRCWRNILGLDGQPWPYVSYANYKLTEILRMAGERPWAFVDDDMGYELRGLGWTRDMVNGLLIEPDPDEGLTDDHVEQLLDFARTRAQ